jgi:hypothetical protein
MTYEEKVDRLRHHYVWMVFWGRSKWQAYMMLRCYVRMYSLK